MLDSASYALGLRDGKARAETPLGVDMFPAIANNAATATDGFTLTNCTIADTVDNDGVPVVEVTVTSTSGSMVATVESSSPAAGLRATAVLAKGPSGRSVAVRADGAGGSASEALATYSRKVMDGSHFYELATVGRVVQSDRTSVKLYLDFAGTTNGDVFQIKGLRHSATGTPPALLPDARKPTLTPSGSPLLDWHGTGGSTSPWTQTGGTATTSIDNDELKVVVGNNVGVYAGAYAMTDDRYFAFKVTGLYADAPGAARLDFTSSVGAVLSSKTVNLTTTPQDFTLQWRPSSDGSYRVVVRNLSGASMTFRFSDALVDAQPEILDPAAGRILLPASALITPTAGEWTVKFRPKWPSSCPPSSCVLRQWGDTTNGLVLEVLQNKLRLSSYVAGVQEKVDLPYQFGYGQTITVSASWTETSLSLEARGGFDPSSAVLSDEFDRADSSSLGDADTGQAWGATGNTPLAIQSGRMTHTQPAVRGAGYAYVSLDATPLRFGGVGSFKQGGSGRTGTLVLLGSLETWWTTSFGKLGAHVFVSPDGWNYQTTSTGVGDLSAGSIGQEQLHQADDGTTFDFWVTFIAPDEACVEIGTGEWSILRDPRVQQLCGRHIGWEVQDSTSDSQPRWESVAAHIETSIGTATAERTAVPGINATTVDVGSDGSSGQIVGTIVAV